MKTHLRIYSLRQSKGIKILEEVNKNWKWLVANHDQMI